MGPAVPVPWVPEPKYELHTFPEPGLGPGLELLTAIMRHYQRSPDDCCSPPASWPGICARPLVTHSGTAKRISLNDHCTPTQWVDDLAACLRALGINPEVPPAAT